MASAPDREARLAEILEATQSHLRAYIAGLGANPSDVDDLAQDVYLELYRDMDRMPEGLEPIRWLKGIARNLCLSRFRRESRRRDARLLELMDRTAGRFEDPVALEEAVAKLRECLARLNERQRELITLRYAEGLGSSALAERFALSVEAVRVTLFRLRGRLKDCITQGLGRGT
ncbi:MAG: sigma-70 family RNA polymerase sigma factor [Planctomycetota bacterium]|nr:sigma-70 family RNA polymerase sigma factor [Planctomycetota bacterium]